MGLVASSALTLVLLRILPADPLAQGIPYSRVALAADGALMRMTLAADGQYRLHTPLRLIAPSTVEAILLKEDRHFHRHPGVNPAALARAAWSTYWAGSRQGGSTLTMQLARRLYRLNTRHIPGKLQQMAMALWIEARHGKQEILETYLSLAPMGGNIEGVAAAARIYFGKNAAQLSVAESLALAVLPQNPSGRSDFGADLQFARRQLAGRWRDSHPRSESTELSAALPVAARSRSQLPFLAPHLTEQLFTEFTGATSIDTTIDLRLQGLMERLLRQYVDERRGVGIVNATALLVDRRDLSVKALVGSADYFDAAIAGQVNGVLAKRSPGSTLKPFLYGLAMDQGLIHPLSILKDAPTAFGPFTPENFDGRFAGPVHARDALVRSRNVPAVWLATQVRQPSLHGFLKSAGISRLRSESHYGLALALGGGDLSMEELAGLYAMLGNGGVFKPLRYRRSAPDPDGVQLLSDEAAFLVLDMLRSAPRPDGLPDGSRGRNWRVAWKTGTSWGFRDAWTAGLVGDYVVVIWVGNFDGRGNPAFVGVEAAAPLFFRVADALPLALANERSAPDLPPRSLTRVNICAASGDLPNAWCPQTLSSWFIPGRSPIRVSNLHRPVLVDTRTGNAACPPIDPTFTRQEVFEYWSSDMLRLFRLAGMPRRTPPDTVQGCTANSKISAAGDEVPRVRSPMENVTYTLRLSRPDESIPLRASLAADARTLYWFADTRYLGQSPGDSGLPWRPDAGRHYELTAVDDHGRSVRRNLRVEFVP
ncbi:MAG: penicillin-binding protein 1C [Gammaproteobacteria bacterium RIFCSPLOWO2_02_FULL_61_13]|nr:MAG: penicillin-binding protein 1C [Gammaproteobacteria bacterium RIFCSPLOWO2_02_FULL_61_13]